MSAALESLMQDAPQARMAKGPLLGGMVNFVGIGVCAALSFVALSTAIISLNTGVADWIVNAVCYGAMIVPVYLLQRHYSFHSHAPHRQALPRYVAVQAMALVLAALFSYLVHGMLSLPTVLASLLVIGLTSGVNFFVLRAWAFARTGFVAATA